MLLISCMQQEVCSVAAHICQRMARGSSHSRRSNAEADPEQPQEALKRALLTKWTPTRVCILVQRPHVRPNAAHADMRVCITSSDVEVKALYQTLGSVSLLQVQHALGGGTRC